MKNLTLKQYEKVRNLAKNVVIQVRHIIREKPTVEQLENIEGVVYSTTFEAIVDFYEFLQKEST